MATKPQRLALGLLFVAASSLAVIKLFETRIVSLLSPYMGGKKLCVDNKANLPDVATFGPKDGCVQIKQSAATLVDRVELGLVIVVIVLSVWVVVRFSLKFIASHR